MFFTDLLLANVPRKNMYLLDPGKSAKKTGKLKTTDQKVQIHLGSLKLAANTDKRINLALKISHQSFPLEILLAIGNGATVV